MPVVSKPPKEEDCRLLWRHVTNLVQGINALVNMTVSVEAKVRGIGFLSVYPSRSLLRIQLGDSGDLVGSTGVTRTPVTVVVTSNENPATIGESIVFTATIPPNADGTMQFFIDGVPFGSPVVIISGLATSGATTTLTVGDHTIQAEYSGNGLYLPSTGSLTQTISPLITPTVTVTNILGGNPATTTANLQWKAVVSHSGPRPTGTVQFKIGGNNFGGRETIDNTGTALSDQTGSPNNLGAGNHLIEAHYNGDSNYNGATGSMTQSIGLVIPPVLVTGSVNPVQVNHAVFFTAVVPTDATGTMQFYIDGIAFGGAVGIVLGFADSGSITTLTVGTHLIEAHYSGNSIYDPAVGSTNEIVVAAPVPLVTLTNILGGNPAPPNTAVQWQVVVHAIPPGPTPTGTVQFLIDGGPFGPSVALDGSGAQVSNQINSLTPGDHTISANYFGDVNYGVAAGQMIQSIMRHPVVALVIVPNPATPNDTVQFKTQVFGSGPAPQPIPQGNVTLFKDGVQWGATQPVDSTGYAFWQVSPGTPVGNHTMRVDYAGNSIYLPGSSPDVVWQIQTAGYPDHFIMLYPSNPPAFNVPLIGTVDLYELSTHTGILYNGQIVWVRLYDSGNLILYAADGVTQVYNGPPLVQVVINGAWVTMDSVTALGVTMVQNPNNNSSLFYSNMVVTTPPGWVYGVNWFHGSGYARFCTVDQSNNIWQLAEIAGYSNFHQYNVLTP